MAAWLERDAGSQEPGNTKRHSSGGRVFWELGVRNTTGHRKHRDKVCFFGVGLRVRVGFFGSGLRAKAFLSLTRVSEPGCVSFTGSAFRTRLVFFFDSGSNARNSIGGTWLFKYAGLLSLKKGKIMFHHMECVSSHGMLEQKWSNNPVILCFYMEPVTT